MKLKIRKYSTLISIVINIWIHYKIYKNVSLKFLM
jgi:hypothetical protein